MLCIEICRKLFYDLNDDEPMPFSTGHMWGRFMFSSLLFSCVGAVFGHHQRGWTQKLTSDGVEQMIWILWTSVSWCVAESMWYCHWSTTKIIRKIDDNKHFEWSKQRRNLAFFPLHKLMTTSHWSCQNQQRSSLGCQSGGRGSLLCLWIRRSLWIIS